MGRSGGREQERAGYVEQGGGEETDQQSVVGQFDGLHEQLEGLANRSHVHHVEKA